MLFAIRTGITQRQAGIGAVTCRRLPDFLVEPGQAAMNGITGGGIGIEIVSDAIKNKPGVLDVVRIPSDHRTYMAVGGNEIARKGIESAHDIGQLAFGIGDLETLNDRA